MEGYVREYIEDIRDYSARPMRAMYAATGLADAIIAGRVEDWRKVWVYVLNTGYEAIRNRGVNKAVNLFISRLTAKDSNETLDAARARYLEQQAAPREPYTDEDSGYEPTTETHWGKELPTWATEGEWKK